MSDSQPPTPWKLVQSKAVRIAVWYAVWGAVWIFGSNWLARNWVQDEFVRWPSEMVTDWLFIGLTAFVLGWVLNRYFKELQEGEQKLRLFVEHSPAAIAMLDRDMRYVAVSRRWLVDYRLQEPEIIGRSHYEIFPDLPERWKQIHQHCLTGTVEKSEADPFLRQDGSTDWVRWEIQPWRNIRNEVGGLIIFSEVITERRNREREIDRLTRLYATLSQVNQTIVRCRSQEELFTDICRIMIDSGKFRAVCISQVRADGGLRPVAQRLQSQAGISSLPFGSEECKASAQALREGRPVFLNNVRIDGAAAGGGPHSCAALPLYLEGKGFGTFTICAPETDFFQPEENRLLEEIAGDISFALDRLYEQEQRREVQEALGTKSAQLQAALASMTDAVFISDATGRFIEFNEAFATFHKFKSKAECATTFAEYPDLLDVFLADGQPAPVEQWAVPRALRGETGANVEYSLRRKDTKECWVGSYSFAPIRDQAGAIVGSVVVGRDITERKRAEEALRLSETKFALAFANNPAAIALTRLEDGLVLEINDTWETMTGYRRAEVIGKTARWMWPTPGEAARFLGELHGHGVLRGWEQAFLHKSGELFITEISAQILTFEGQTLILSTLVDITAHKRAEAALRESERLRQAVMDVVPHFIFVKNRESRYLFVNRACAAANNLTPEQMVGKCDLDFMRNRAEAEAFNRADREVIDGGRQLFIAEEQLTDAAGQTRNLQTIKMPFVAPGGEAALLGVAMDVTDLKRAEAALRQSEARLQAILRAAPTGIGLVINRVLHEVNQHVLDMTGYTRDELIGHSSRVLYPSDEEFDRVGREKYQLIAEQQTGTVETRWQCKDGAIIDVLLSSSPLDFSDFSKGVTFTALDISERKQSEAALRENEARYRSLFHENLAAMLMLDPQTGMVVDANPAAARFYGWSIAELRAKGIRDINTASAEEIAAAIDRAQATVRTQFFFQHRLADGSSRDVEVFSSPVTVQGRKLLYSIIHDITARKEAEAALRQSEENFRAMFEVASVGMAQTNPFTGQWTRVNQKMCDITGYGSTEMLALKVSEVTHPEDRDADWALFQQVVRGENPNYHIEKRYLRKDGSIAWVNVHMTAIRNAAGQPVSTMSTIEDITERKQLEAQYQQAQKMEAIGRLAGGVAHDFNNILTSIIMQVELGSTEEGVSRPVRESFEQIQGDAERAANLTRQLLLFSRRQVMQSRDLDLNEVVTNLTKMLQRIIGEDVRLQLNLPSFPLPTHADPGMLDQVLMNLAVNARDAMPDGGCLTIQTAEEAVDELPAECTPDANPGRYVCLSVRDTGCGIPADVLPRIFEPFFTTKEAGRGTGLGLATVFGIVKQHHGWIQVESEPGQGTTFHVYLPAIQKIAQAESRVKPKPRGGTETILLVEDEAAVRRTTEGILTRHGYRILSAANGEEAIALWTRHHDEIALLLTDLVMPGGMSGQQLARQLQQDKPPLKVVYVSGYSADIAGKELQLQDGENFIQKPFQLERLLNTLRGSLDG